MNDAGEGSPQHHTRARPRGSTREEEEQGLSDHGAATNEPEWPDIHASRVHRDAPATDHTSRPAGRAHAGDIGRMVEAILTQAEAAADRISAVTDEQAVAILAVTEEILETFEDAAARLRSGRQELSELLSSRAAPVDVGGVAASAPEPVVVEEWRGWPRP